MPRKLLQRVLFAISIIITFPNLEPAILNSNVIFLPLCFASLERLKTGVGWHFII
jgi:hypothetical protein